MATERVDPVPPAAPCIQCGEPLSAHDGMAWCPALTKRPAADDDFYHRHHQATWDHKEHVGYIEFTEDRKDRLSVRQIERKATVIYDVTAAGILIGAEILAEGPNSQRVDPVEDPTPDTAAFRAIAADWGLDSGWLRNALEEAADKLDAEREAHRNTAAELADLRKYMGAPRAWRQDRDDEIDALAARIAAVEKICALSGNDGKTVNAIRRALAGSAQPATHQLDVVNLCCTKNPSDPVHIQRADALTEGND